jgi:hypothetical protein
MIFFVQPTVANGAGDAIRQSRAQRRLALSRPVVQITVDGLPVLCESAHAQIAILI